MEFEDRVIRTVMSAVQEYGFAIAGGRAALVHEIVDRKTEDLDAFSDRYNDDVLDQAVNQALLVLREAGFNAEVRAELSTPTFSRIHVTDESAEMMHVDLGYDWREYPTVNSEYGPVIDLRDLAANKMSALWGRSEVRDAIDVHGLLTTGKFTQAELLVIARESDAGFHESYFWDSVRNIVQYPDSEFLKYGVEAEEAATIRATFAQWASHQATLTDQTNPSQNPTADPNV